MANWTPAPALKQLRSQLNAQAPNRSKASDGMIGDTAHATERSEHNPNSAGVVTAFDVTNDPAHGMSCEWLAQTLVNNKDPRIWYIIWNGRITGYEYDWKWNPYKGKNPHDKHLHISVKQFPVSYNNATPWDLGSVAAATKGEDEVIPTKDLLDSVFWNYMRTKPNKAEYERYVGKITYNQLIPLLDASPEHQKKEAALQYGLNAMRDKWEDRLNKLQSGTPTKEQVIKFIESVKE